MSMENYITRREHEEFSLRIAAEDARQNRRIQLLEDNVRQVNALTVSVEKMAVNMGNMLEEQRKQGERLEALEKEPAEAHRQIRMSVTTALVGAVVGAIAAAILALL